MLASFFFNYPFGTKSSGDCVLFSRLQSFEQNLVLHLITYMRESCVPFLGLNVMIKELKERLRGDAVERNSRDDERHWRE